MTTGRHADRRRPMRLARPRAETLVIAGSAVVIAVCVGVMSSGAGGETQPSRHRPSITIAVPASTASPAPISTTITTRTPAPIPAQAAVEGELRAGAGISSPGGEYRLSMQGDGNLVLYRGQSPIWATGTSSGVRAVVTAAGDWRVLDSAGGVLWSTGTTGRGPSRIEVRDDGNIVLRVVAGGAASWSRTPIRAAAPPPPSEAASADSPSPSGSAATETTPAQPIAEPSSPDTSSDPQPTAPGPSPTDTAAATETPTPEPTDSGTVEPGPSGP